MCLRFCALVVAVGFGCPVFANKPRTNVPVLEGVVSQVINGDTLLFKPADQTALRVRLRDIDAPEACQAGGEESRRALADLALNKRATLRSSGRNAAGDTLAVVIVDEVNLSVRQVEEGHAWSVRGRNDRGPLVKQERMAHALKRGLHAAGTAVPPADFRRAHGPCVPPAR